MAYIAENEVSRLLNDLDSIKAELSTGELFTLANIYLSRSEYKHAVALYDSLNEAYPKWSCPWRHKGEAYYRLKDFNEASAALQQAIATNAKHYDAYIWMAMTLKELGQYSAALKHLDKALELSPDAEQSEDDALSQAQIQSLYKELQDQTRK
jgi:tetratricopeptide (TPR) repeat protein